MQRRFIASRNQQRQRNLHTLQQCPCGFRTLPEVHAAADASADSTPFASDGGSSATLRAPPTPPSISDGGSTADWPALQPSARSSTAASPRSVTSSAAFGTDAHDAANATPAAAAATGTPTDATHDPTTEAAIGATSDAPAGGLPPTVQDSSLDNLDDLTLRVTLGGLGATDLWQCIRAGGRMGRVARDVLQRSELVCFHSKVGCCVQRRLVVWPAAACFVTLPSSAGAMLFAPF